MNAYINSGLMVGADVESSRQSRIPWEWSGLYLIEFQPTTIGQFWFGATPYFTIYIGI